MILKCQCRIQQNGGSPFEWIFEVPFYPNVSPAYSIEVKLKEILSERTGSDIKDAVVVNKRDSHITEDNIYKQVINAYYNIEYPRDSFTVDIAIVSSYMEAQIQLHRLQEHIQREMEYIKTLMRK